MVKRPRADEELGKTPGSYGISNEEEMKRPRADEELGKTLGSYGISNEEEIESIICSIKFILKQGNDVSRSAINNLVEALKKMKDRIQGLDSYADELRTVAEQRELENSKYIASLETSSRKTQENYEAMMEILNQKEREMEEKEKEIEQMSSSINAMKRDIKKLQVELKSASDGKTLSETQVEQIKLALGGEEIVCPIFQENGVITSLDYIIKQWVNSPGEEFAFRKFTCPEKGYETGIGSYNSIKIVRKVAGMIGMDVKCPITFTKNSEEFEFNDQLNLIGALCLVAKRKETKMLAAGETLIKMEAKGNEIKITSSDGAKIKIDVGTYFPSIKFTSA